MQKSEHLIDLQGRERSVGFDDVEMGKLPKVSRVWWPVPRVEMVDI